MNDYTFAIQRNPTTNEYYWTSHSETERDPLKTIDIVFISEGYTSQQMDEYVAAVQSIESHLFATDPFNRYKDFFNVKWVKLVSDHAFGEGTTALDAADYGDRYPALIVNFQKVMAVLEDAGLSGEGEGKANVIIVVVNADAASHRSFGIHPDILKAMGMDNSLGEDGQRRLKDLIDKLSGSSWPLPTIEDPEYPGLQKVDFGNASGIAVVTSMGTTSNEEDYKDIAVHEFGHAFAGLFDEYSGGTPALGNGVEYDEGDVPPNLLTLWQYQLDYNAPPQHWSDLQEQLAPEILDKIKWSHWFGPTTPVPVSLDEQEQNPNSYENTVSLFVGGGYSQPAGYGQRATYRSKLNCKMRLATDAFCAVCKEALVRTIYEHQGLRLTLDPLEPHVEFPAEKVSLTLGVTTKVTPVSSSPSEAYLEYGWSFSPPSSSAFPEHSLHEVELTRQDSGEIAAEPFGYSFTPDWPDLTVTVTVKDTTPLVRRSDIKALMQEEATWQVKLGSVLADSPWPTFQHDLRRTGRAQVAGPLNPFVEWTNRGPFNSSATPVIGEDGAIYTAWVDTGLVALARESGVEIWRFSPPSPKLLTTPLAAVAPADSPDEDKKRLIYVGSKDGGAYCLNANGERVWGIDDLVNNSGLTIHRVPGAAGIGRCHTSYLGAVREDPSNFDRVTAYLYGVDKTGSSRWSISGWGAGGCRFDAATPAVSDEGMIYIAYKDPAYSIGYLIALKPDGQEEGWGDFGRGAVIGTVGEQGVGPQGNLLGPVVGDDGTIYVAMGKRLRAFQPDGSTKWTRDMNADITALPVIGGNDTVYVAAGNEIHALTTSYGESVWRGPISTGGTVSCLALDGNGTLYAASAGPNVGEAGKLYGIIGAEKRMEWPFTSVQPPTSMVIGGDTIYVMLWEQLYAVTEALLVDGYDCDIRVTDELGRWVGPPETRWVGHSLPGATYGLLGGHTGVRAAIPHPIKNSVYQVEVSPLGGGPVDPDQPYELWVTEGLNRYLLAKGVFGDLPGEPYTFQYPTPTITAIIIRPEDLPVFNGQAILISGGSGTFTAIGIDVLGREHILPARRWRLSRSVGVLKTIGKNRARVRASARAGVRGVLSITFRKMTARLPVRIVSSRPRRARRTLKRN